MTKTREEAIDFGLDRIQIIKDELRDLRKELRKSKALSDGDYARNFCEELERALNAINRANFIIEIVP